VSNDLNLIQMLGLLAGGLALFLFGLELMTGGLNAVQTRTTTHAIGSITSRCRSGAVEAIAPRTRKARMWPTLWARFS